MDTLTCLVRHVHPRSILTHQLFAHNLCAKPVSSDSGHTDLGIRIRLGEAENAGLQSSLNSNDIVVYGRPHPSSSVMQLCVALILPPPTPAPLPKAVTRLRPPRPDDPIPRLPPVGFGLASRGVKRTLDKGKGKEKEEGDSRKRPKKLQETESVPKKGASKAGLVPTTNIQELGKNSRIGKEDLNVFVVPPTPMHRTKSKAASGDTDDNTFFAPTNGHHNGDVELRNRTVRCVFKKK